MIESGAVHVDVRRIAPTDGAVLKATRLAALADSPFAFGSTYDDEVTRSDDEWLERARFAATGHARSMFLARTGQRVVGLAGGYREDDQPSSVELVSMWTSPEVRRSGAGRLLVSAVVLWAADTQATSVGLWVTRGNEPAQRLYEAMGFRVTGDVQSLPSNPCADEIRMLLDLD
jgi:ribosomal protein S18 acetylase RimI-like enzyme